MEDTSQQSFDRFGSIPSPGERVIDLHNVTDQPLSPKDERIVSTNTSPDAVISGSSINAKDQPTLEKSGTLSSAHPFDVQNDQGFLFGGFDNGTNPWDEQSSYVNANSLHVVPPAMYNENPSVFFPPGYGYDTHMAYGQFSPMPSPLSSIMIDGQLYSQHQIPVSPSYFPPVSPGLPHVSSALTMSQTEMIAPASSGQENLVDNVFFGPGSGFYVPFGSFSGGDLSGNNGMGFYKFPGEFGSGEQVSNQPNSLESSRYMSQLASGPVYPQPIGILGSYEQNVAQAPFQGVGLPSSSSVGHFPPSGAYPSMKYSAGSGSHWDSSQRNRFSMDKGGRRDRERDSISYPLDSFGISSDRNRGPRASKPKNKNSADENSSSSIHKDVESTSGLQLDKYNSPEFVTDYENAKFFVIKSFSEDNIHKSIKYGVWASTSLGNRKLDAAYKEVKELPGNCPVFLFFSVNASGQFCGIAEMVGPVDFENDADYWQQDRWSGQFPVKWHIIKDVPNSRFRHILLENNDNKPVTHSRDSQEVKLEQGIEMLKIFKDYEADTILLDDFTYYDEREKALLEKKAKQRVSSTGNSTVPHATDPINQLSDNLADTLSLDGSKSVPKQS